MHVLVPSKTNLDLLELKFSKEYNKDLPGDAIPHKINQKLPLYAEFPEFSRKQIKFFTETFKK